MNSPRAKEKAKWHRGHPRCRFSLEEAHVGLSVSGRLSIQKRMSECLFVFFQQWREYPADFKPQNFAHLAGLRKPNDVYEFQAIRSASNIYHEVLKKNITDLHLQMSVHYDSDARERIQHLSRLEELLNTDKAIWNFDAKKSTIATRLKSKVILFKPDGFDFYLMLGAAPDGSTWYPETFFLRFDDQYLKGQEIVSITALSKTSR